MSIGLVSGRCGWDLPPYEVFCVAVQNTVFRELKRVLPVNNFTIAAVFLDKFKVSGHYQITKEKGCQLTLSEDRPRRKGATRSCIRT